MAVRPLTVLQLLPALEGGGVERGTLEVAQALAEEGHRSLVISAGGRLVSQLEAAGSQHIAWPIDRKSLWTFRCVRPLRRLLEAERVDVMHVRSRVPAWVAWLAWRGMPTESRPRLVTTMHGLHSVSSYSAIMTRGERVIAVSDTVKRYILENYPTTDERRIQVIYRGVDPADFTRGYQPAEGWLAQWRQTYPQLEGRFVIALPGRMTRLKGHHDFLQLVSRLKQGGLQVAGLVVGGEDRKRQAYAREIYREAEQLGLGQEVIFTGHRDDIRDIYSQCDLVLSLSNKPESFGRTVLEVLSMGIPVLGYDHGGVGEVLGRLFPFGRVPLGDVAAMAEKIFQIRDNGAPPIGENDCFLKSDMLKQTLAIYRELADASVATVQANRAEP